MAALTLQAESKARELHLKSLNSEGINNDLSHQKEQENGWTQRRMNEGLVTF